MRILLCNNQLGKFAGSEIHCLELAQYLADNGHLLTMAAFKVGAPIAAEFAKLGIEIVSLATEPLPSDWDIIWTHHVTCFCEIHVRRCLRAGRHVHGLLSSVVPLERVPVPAGVPRPRPGFRLLANAPLTRKVAKESLPAEILWNLAPDRWIRAEGARSRLESIVVVSNHPPPEVLALKPIAEKNGIDFTIIGKGHEEVLVSPEVLAPHDVVISIGKTVHYCLAAGIPVFVYDHFGGPGWLTARNIKAAEHDIFSGKCTPGQRSPDTLFRELARGFAKSCKFHLSRREWAARRYGVEQQLTCLGLLEPVDKYRRLLNRASTRRAALAIEAAVLGKAPPKNAWWRDRLAKLLDRVG